ncbi:hypothetical protein LINPERPRIM_LOCUS33684 [Linum perenne]
MKTTLQKLLCIW